MHPGILKHPCFIPTFLVFIILSACTGSDRSVSQIPIPQYPQLNLTSTEDLSGFPTAIHITELTTQDAYLSLFTTEKTASLVVLENTDNQWEKHTEQNISISDSGFSYYDLKDLKPNTAYASYALSIDHTRRTSITFFRTPIDSGTTRLIRFGATSCFGSNNRPWAPLNHAAAQNLDFFLLLGDTVYADQSQNLQGYRDFWSYTQSVPGFRNLASSSVTSGCASSRAARTRRRSRRGVVVETKAG